MGMKWKILVVLISISRLLMRSSLFCHMVIGHLETFRESLIQVSCPFFSSLNFKCYLYISDITSLLFICIEDTLTHSVFTLSFFLSFSFYSFFSPPLLPSSTPTCIIILLNPRNCPRPLAFYREGN